MRLYLVSVLHPSNAVHITEADVQSLVFVAGIGRLISSGSSGGIYCIWERQEIAISAKHDYYFNQLWVCQLQFAEDNTIL